MAVIIEFANVILRKSAVEIHVSGGVDALAQLPLPNLAEDDHLLRVGFMATSYAEHFISEVQALASPSFALEGNVAIIQWGVLPYPAWVSVGMVDNEGACWLAGTPPGALVRCDQSRTFICHGITEARLLESLGAIAQTSVGAPGADGDVRLTCTRGDALVEGQLMKGDDRLIIILERKFSRRRQRTADLALLDDLAEALGSLGAQSLT